MTVQSLIDELAKRKPDTLVEFWTETGTGEEVRLEMDSIGLGKHDEALIWVSPVEEDDELDELDEEFEEAGDGS